MSDTLRDKFTKNAEEFDALMVKMLAENERLTKERDELTASNARLVSVCVKLLTTPRADERDFCAHLIELYRVVNDTPAQSLARIEARTLRRVASDLHATAMQIEKVYGRNAISETLHREAAALEAEAKEMKE